MSKCPKVLGTIASKDLGMGHGIHIYTYMSLSTYICTYLCSVFTCSNEYSKRNSHEFASYVIYLPHLLKMC